MVLLHTSTVLAQTPAVLLSHLSRLPKVYTENTLLFTLSTNADVDNLPNLVSRLTSLSSESVGCLSAPPDDRPRLGDEDPIVCSLAAFDRKNCRTFRSTIPGRPAPQVGRWRAFRKNDEKMNTAYETIGDERVNWEEVWNRSIGGYTLPSELECLSPDSVSGVIYFSDGAPEGLSNALGAFPAATKFGMIASSTPFITGRPVTLFKNDRIYSSGAVGIALTTGVPKLRYVFPGLKAITERMTVTRSEGNLLIEVDKCNPTQLLLSAIHAHGLHMTHKGAAQAAPKDDEKIYVGAFEGNGLNQIYEISSSDPSRGTIALNSPSAPKADTQIQFYYLTKSSGSSETSSFQHQLMRSKFPSVTFFNPFSHSSQHVSPSLPHEGMVLESFWAASENGLVMSRGRTDKEMVGKSGEEAWRCTIPGATVTLEWT